MATLNFKGAHTFSITGGIYSEARHVTMISSSADPRLIARRDHHRHGSRSSRSNGSFRRRPRTPSPSSSESSFVSSNDSGPSTRSSPPTSVDEHESSLSQPVPTSSHERPEVLSPLSSRLGAMAGLTTPVDMQTPVVSRLTNLPSRTPDRVIPVLPRSNEASTAAGNNVSSRLYRHPGVESARDVGIRIQPQGPRRPRPLPPTPRSSQYVHPGTPADFITDSHSHIPDSSSSSSSWDTSIQEPPRSFARSSTVPPRPPQPILPSRHTVRVDLLAPSPSYAIENYYPSRSSSAQVFMTSPIREPFAESVTPPSRRSVQSPPPNLPFQTISLPTQSTPSTRTSRSRRSVQSPPQNLLFQTNPQSLPFQPTPLPPQSTPPHTSAASRSYVTSRSSRPAFRPSPGPARQLYQSSLWPMDHSEINMQPPISYQHVPRPPPTQNLPDQDLIYISSSGAPQHYLPRSPNFAAAGLAYYLSPLQSEQSAYEHSYEYY